ncbi:MAG: hypothetical protein COA44_06090 [Arcobacter sp.]|nr:MAG: hypothetical protein COA44_06090 [Arcobacter sp.]
MSIYAYPFYGFLLWVLYYVVKGYLQEDKPSQPNDKAFTKKQDAFKVIDIPEGYEVYEDDDFFIQGVTYRMDACVKWATGENLELSFKREPNNKHDDNAIAIYGKSSTGKRRLGYVAAEIADELVYKELDDKIKPRLLSVEIKEAPFINYEILVESKAYALVED